jgi:leader peptidase (prepilin peptidase)/N-methyltransferase
MPSIYTLLPGLPEWFWYPITFIYGAIVGSFVNVVIYRLPLGMSLSRQASHCPHCNHYLRAWDNVPLLGFLAVGGKCRYCRAPISWRYFTIELLTACLWVALYQRVSGQTSISWVDYVAQALFASVLIAMIFIDLDHFIAPDELNYVGIFLGVGRDIVCLVMAYSAGSYVWAEWSDRFAYFHYLPRALPGGLVYGGVLFAVSMIGFVYYAREPGESVASVLRRFFVDDEIEPATETAVMDEPATVDAEPEDDEAPPRLRFAPGFIALVSAALLATVVGAWGLLALALPALGFGLLARRTGEPFGRALVRFFHSDEDVLFGKGEEDLEAAADADQFAREAETGQHGGMGLGDVKLALAIGAILGPALALLSLFVATFVGATTGIAIAIRHRRSLRYGVPFVPFMAVGAIVTMLFGPAFLTWYVGLMSPEKPVPPAVPIRRAHRPALTSRQAPIPASSIGRSAPVSAPRGR